MSTDAPDLAVVQIVREGPRPIPGHGGPSPNPTFGLALINRQDTAFPLQDVFDEALVMVDEPSLDEAARALQARCLADLNLDPVDLPLLNSDGDQIGSARDLGLQPFNSA